MSPRPSPSSIVMPSQIGHYRVEKPLGRGAHGVVYQAYDTRLLRRVVLKQLHGTGWVHDKQILSEAQLASAIEHPNVCSIYELGEEDGRPFMAMQHVPGRTLAQLIADGPSSSYVAAAIGYQIASGLAAAHDHGILHRDLKPSNVMITESGLVKVLDFGLAKRHFQEVSEQIADGRRLDPTTSSPKGTMGYMAPECFAGAPSSVRSDIYAVGMMLYVMLAGHHPYVGQVGAELVRAAMLQSPPRLTRLRADIDESLARLIEQAMAREPVDRFETAADLRAGLGILSQTLGPDTDNWSSRGVSLGARVPRKPSLWASLARRLRGNATEQLDETAIAVTPFRLNGPLGAPASYGVALAEAVATRLSREPSLRVRMPASLTPPEDPVAYARTVESGWVVAGALYEESGCKFVSWYLGDTKLDQITVGGQVEVGDDDWVQAQDRICREATAAIRSRLAPHSKRNHSQSPFADELYWEGRAWLAQFDLRTSRHGHLENARRAFEEVLAKREEDAEAHSALGLVYLRRVQSGFGGPKDLDRARVEFERAIELDPNAWEPKLHRISTLLPAGFKEMARHSACHLWDVASGNFNVHMVVGHLLRLDGCYDRALVEFSSALHANPAQAHLVYVARSRIHLYRGALDEAQSVLDRALALQPEHPEALTGLAYLRIRQRRHREAIEILEGLMRAEPRLSMSAPTLALAHIACGNTERADAIIDDSTCANAESHADAAYRIASVHAAAGRREPALTWLRKAIYLGNENFPWLSSNPIWDGMRDDADLGLLLQALEERHRRHVDLWNRLLG